MSDRLDHAFGDVAEAREQARLFFERLVKAFGGFLQALLNRRGQSGLWSFGISGDVPIVLLRIGTLLTMVLSVLSLLATFHDNPTYASYWTTPAACAVQAAQYFLALLLPLLLFLLVLPPLARRMV